MNHFSYRSTSYSGESAACRGKRAHRSQHAATLALVGHYLQFRDPGVRAYPCGYCGLWDVGHPSRAFNAARTCRAIEAAMAVPGPAGAFLASLRRRAFAAVDKLCRAHGGDPEELLAVLTDQVTAPGVLDRLSAAQCEDILLACEAVEVHQRQWAARRAGASC